MFELQRSGLDRRPTAFQSSHKSGRHSRVNEVPYDLELVGLEADWNITYDRSSTGGHVFDFHEAHSLPAELSGDMFTYSIGSPGPEVVRTPARAEVRFMRPACKHPLPATLVSASRETPPKVGLRPRQAPPRMPTSGETTGGAVANWGQSA